MCKRTVIGTLLFVDLGLTNVTDEAGVGGAALEVVVPGFPEAELAVHGQADFGRVAVLLAIVLPPTDWA